MKTNKFLALVLGLVTMLFVNSCVEDDDFAVPEVLVPAVDASAFGTKTTFAAVAARYADAIAGGDDVGTWEFDAPLYVEGYVISSDASGNFFEEIIIQNSTDENDLTGDPRKGLKVEINVRDLSNFYNYGRKVYVRLNGLAVGESNGVLTLGRANGNTLQQLEPFEYKDFVIRDQEVVTISPKMVAIADLSEDDENTLIQISDAQFVRGAIESTNTYAGEATDQFDGFRTIENCETGSTIALQTSTFADFKSFPLAAGRGTISGIYSRDFGGDFSVLIVNDTNSIDFSNTDRCDPAEFFISSTPVNCDDTTINGATTIFSDDFENYGDTAELTAAGWSLINIGGGSYTWGISDFGGNTYAIGNAFDTGEADMDTWLISPEINLDNTTEDVLNFDVQTNFNGGEVMSVYISTDFVDTSIDSNWSLLEDVTIPDGPSNGFGSFEAAGPVNLTCVTGNVRIAFRYTGSDPGVTTRYHVDNVEVTGN